MPRNLGTGADHPKPRHQEHPTSRPKHTHSMKHIKTKSTCKGKCIKCNRKLLTLRHWKLPCHRPGTEMQSLAAMQSIGCPPVHQSRRTNMSIKCQWKRQATDVQHTHSYPDSQPCVRKTFSASFVYQPAKTTLFTREVFAGKSQMKTLPH